MAKPFRGTNKKPTSKQRTTINSPPTTTTSIIYDGALKVTHTCAETRATTGVLSFLKAPKEMMDVGVACISTTNTDSKPTGFARQET